MPGPPPSPFEAVPEEATRFAAPSGRPTVAGRVAEEVLAEARVPLRLDRATALGFLVYDAYDARRTFFERLVPVPMRTAVVAKEDGTLAIATPRGPPPLSLGPKAAGMALRDALDAAVLDAIKGAARVAVTASGGLDSN